ncbi:MAG: NAD-binding protein, partial [Deltaproteobacteria bacterium]|nr:NAD-binding protein [Deltaproteobacteria bacterium]
MSALIALVLGAFGYAEYYEATSSGEGSPGLFALFRDSARLLFVESSASDNFPDALRMARFFAFLSWGAAGVKGFLTFAKRRIELARSRRHQDHAVVCGLGRLGAQLVNDLRAQEIRTIVIELDAENPEVAVARAEGTLVLVGNATSGTTLRDAAAQRARYIFTVTGDDRVNIEIASKALEVRNSYDGDDFVQQCAVHVDDPEISTLFSERPLFKDRTERFDAHFFNINRLSARVLIDRYPPDRFQRVHSLGDPAASIMVFGADALAQQIVTQLARIGHYGNKKKAVVRLVPGEKTGLSRVMEKRSIALREFLDLRIEETTELESLLRDDDLLEEVVSERAPSVAY